MAPPRFVSLVPLLLAAGLAACAGSAGPQQSSYRYFTEPQAERDPWFQKVSEWQQRERAHRPETTLADLETRRAKPNSGLLRVKMGIWESQERHSMARRLAAWAQAEARRHYRVDPPTNVTDDPWPTTKDLLDYNGDDCDGLDLITYELMRQFGFPADELFRAIVRRDRDGANHMVTLWFEETDDPWVVDATGAVSLRVRRFSKLPGWTPTKVFNERVQYTPARLGGLGAMARTRGTPERP